MTNLIHVDRSRLETREKCQRKAYWQYDWQGRGIERQGDLKLDARIGTWCHNGIEHGLEALQLWFAKEEAIGAMFTIALQAGKDFLKDCYSVVNIYQDTVSNQLKHDIVEGGQIVTALAYAWLRTVAPRLLSEGEVLAIERELETDFPVATPATVTRPIIYNETIVRLMSRPDIIWRRQSDGTIFIRNLKTTRRADDKFREKWALDQQTLSEPLAVDEWLKGHTEPPLSEGAITEGRASAPYDSPEVCGGVIIDGLVTGEVLFDKFRKVFYHNNPLIYCWRSGDIGISGQVEFYPKYEWSCTGPHKFANGRKCEGGHTHKLSGVTKVAVADSYPGGIIAWIDYLISNHPDVIAECIVELPPIIRSEYQIERWKRQTLQREVAIKRWAAQADAADGVRREELLDSYFPMSTSGGNCLYPGRCAFFECCHGSSAGDPLASGYQVRVPNHPSEGDVK